MRGRLPEIIERIKKEIESNYGSRKMEGPIGNKRGEPPLFYGKLKDENPLTITPHHNSGFDQRYVSLYSIDVIQGLALYSYWITPMTFEEGYGQYTIGGQVYLGLGFCSIMLIDDFEYIIDKDQNLVYGEYSADLKIKNILVKQKQADIIHKIEEMKKS